MNFFIPALFIQLFLVCVPAAAADLSRVLHFASVTEGRQLLTAEDDYTGKWSTFDIQSRLGELEGTKAGLLDMIGHQVLAWTPEEEAKVRASAQRIDSMAAAEGFRIPLPPSVTLIKTTLKEEGGAMGYTRGEFIVLRPDLFYRDAAEIDHILLHEIFHILTRTQPELRKQMYRLIGFTVDQPLEYPVEYRDIRLTNPDAHAFDSYIRLETPDGDTAECMMMLYARRPYEGGSFLTYLGIGMLETEGAGGDRRVVYINDEPAVHPLDAVGGFFTQIGRNTNYIIDPEEIMADNFAYAFTHDERPDMRIVEGIRKILRTP